MVVGVSDSYEIRTFAADGSLVGIVRRDWDPRTPIQAEYDERAPWGVPPVDAYPAFDEILSDLAGNLWVREYRMSDEEAMVRPTRPGRQRRHHLLPPRGTTLPSPSRCVRPATDCSPSRGRCRAARASGPARSPA